MALAAAGFEVGMRELETLKPHEQTIPAHVEQMARRLREDGAQKDPILIDRRSGVVLDGMHRLAAFAHLGLRMAVCCMLDYDSDRVKVGRWARVYLAGGYDEFREVFESEGFTPASHVEDAVATLRGQTAGVTAGFGGKALARGGASGLEESFRTVERIDTAASVRGWKRTFVPEDEVGRELSMKDRAVVLVQKFGKTEVLNAALSGKLFPCKTSMHSVDPRPVEVKFPLGELNQAGSKRLQQILSEKKERLLPAGSIYEGRRYKERLLLLNPD